MAMSGAALGQPEKDERGAFSSRVGFILAAVGSAVGLGNIWRFPFTTAENGGAAFLFVYLIILFAVGIPVMFAELSIGRKGKLNPIGSFNKLSNGNPLWIAAGVLFVLTSLFIISWYSVIAGWVITYVHGSLTGAYFGDSAAYFREVTEGPRALYMHLFVMATVTGALAFGVTKGIERVAFIMMPVLFILAVIVAIYVGTLSGAGAGYSYFFDPNFSELSLGSYIDATGQAFFSLSLGQGAILTYASYLDKREDLVGNGTIIAIADTGVAILGGLMVFPALAFAGALTTEAGPGALFVALAAAFGSMPQTTGIVLGTLFFAALFFAAFTSAISLLEVSIAWVGDQFKIRRWKAAVLMGLIAYALGIAASLDFNLLDVLSGAGTDTVVIFGGLLITLFAGWIMHDTVGELTPEGRSPIIATIALWLIRIPVPIVLVLLILYNIAVMTGLIQA